MKAGELVLAVWVGVLISCAAMLISGHSLTPGEWLTGAKDVATAMGVVVAAYVGIRGLSTWERQLRGNAESARDFWRLQPLRRWSHEQVEQVLT